MVAYRMYQRFLYMQIFNYDERMSSFNHYVKTLAKKNNYKSVMDTFHKYAPHMSMNARLSIRDAFEDVAN